MVLAKTWYYVQFTSIFIVFKNNNNNKQWIVNLSREYNINAMVFLLGMTLIHRAARRQTARSTISTTLSPSTEMRQWRKPPITNSSSHLLLLVDTNSSASSHLLLLVDKILVLAVTFFYWSIQILVLAVTCFYWSIQLLVLAVTSLYWSIQIVAVISLYWSIQIVAVISLYWQSDCWEKTLSAFDSMSYMNNVLSHTKF